MTTIFLRINAGLFGLLFLLIAAADSLAHPGGLNAINCHRDRAAKECHCHTGADEPAAVNLAYCNAKKIREFKRRKRSEADYNARFCAARGGLVEARLEGGLRVDCLTVGHAIEADFAPKWEEAMTQARVYANATGAAPGVLLIMTAPDDDAHLFALCEAALAQTPPPVVFTAGEAAWQSGEINCGELLADN
jgi:hypothetical protein